VVRSASLDIRKYTDLGYRYSTGSNLNTYSALIQNFYSQETTPNQAIHLAVNTGLDEGESVGVKAYVRYALSNYDQLFP
jgi:hypothetical protein